MNLKYLPDAELWSGAQKAAQTEKEATLALLEYFLEIQRRRLFAARGFSSLFEYVVKELGYSESQASERIGAMRLMNEVVEVKEKIQNGSLSLTTAAQIQRFFRTEKKEHQQEFTTEEKLDLVSQCENQSKRQVERVLIEKSANPSTHSVKETERVLHEGKTEIRFMLSRQGSENLQKIREIQGHDLALAEIFKQALMSHLEKLNQKNTCKRTSRKKPTNPAAQSGTSHDLSPVGKTLEPFQDASENLTKESAFPAEPGDVQMDAQIEISPELLFEKSPEIKSEKVSEALSKPLKSTRYIRKSDRQKITERSQNRCEFIDPLTGKRCESRYKLQFEHTQPHSHGGGRETENLMHYCSTHNQLAAIQVFGKEKMSQYVEGLI